MNDIIHNILDRKGAPVLMAFFFVLFVAESVRQLRQRKTSRMGRLIVNGLVAVPGFIALRFMLLPALVFLAIQNEAWQFGLSYWYRLPASMEFIIAFLLLDYTNYLWHRINHGIPLLWRFHLVHHTDTDLDISTAIRFHVGELVASVFFRGLAVVLIGATPLLVLVYEIVFELATQFHHSNWRLPIQLERVLNFIIVTPRMHGIHHSIIHRETDSNYSVIFSWWDRLHGTINLHVPQSRITIGVPGYEQPYKLTFMRLLKLPFTRIKPWPPDPPVDDRKSRDELVE